MSKTSKVLVIGDPHISDRYSGRHVDYFADCVRFAEDTTKTIREKDIDILIITGDIFGRTTEKNLKSRESLMYFMKVFQVWNQLTNGNVYSIRGNHDYGEKLTDFEFFVTVGLIKTVDQLDVGSVRFHMFNYGEHEREIEVKEDAYNVAIMHTELHIEGATNWFYRSHEGVELSDLHNLYGVEMVIGGHIHTPSPYLANTSIKDKEISLFYVGNYTRPKYESNLWESCHGIIFETDDENTSISEVEYKLIPVSEQFRLTYEDIDGDEVLSEEGPVIDIEQLSSILEELKNYNILGDGDYKTQIKKMGGIDKDAVELALKYVEEVESELR